jgi:RNA polymerase sigma-70 factor (ECF subfamily)
MRRIQGLPQKEIARRLGVTENVVEMQAVRGLKLILKALETTDNGDGDAKRKTETRFEVEKNG